MAAECPAVKHLSFASCVVWQVYQRPKKPLLQLKEKKDKMWAVVTNFWIWQWLRGAQAVFFVFVFFSHSIKGFHPLGALGGQWANKASAGTRQWFIRERRLGLLFQPLTLCIWRWWAYYMHISSWKRRRRGAWEIQPGHSLRDVEAPPGWILGWLTLPQELPGYWCWSLLSVSLFLLWRLHKVLGCFLNVMCYKNIAE